MARRKVDIRQIQHVLATSTDVRLVRPGRVVVQQADGSSAGREKLIRVVVDVDRNPPEVVTVYVTTKVSKYTRQP